MFLSTAFLLGVACGESSASRPLTAIAEVDAAFHDPASAGRPFSVTGTVIHLDFLSPGKSSVTLAENGVRVPFIDRQSPPDPALRDNPPELGGRLHLRGTLVQLDNGIWAEFQSAKVLSSGDLDALPKVTPRDMADSQWLNRAVRLDGIVRDAARDEADPSYLHFTVNDAGDAAQVMVRHPATAPFQPLAFLGARIAAFGFCSDNAYGSRKHVGRLLSVCDLNHVHLAAPPATTATAPDIECLTDMLPRKIDAQGLHQAEGTVLAAWGGNQALVQTRSGRIVRACLQRPELLVCGSSVRVVGLPVTDYYTLNLLHATWHPCGPPQPLSPPTDLRSPAELVTNRSGQPRLNVHSQGKTLRIAGLVRHVPNGAATGDRLLVEVDGILVAVDAGAFPNVFSTLECGCRVSVTGTCVINSDNWRMDSTDQRPIGFFLSVRTPADIVVLARPPWWTPGRLMALLGLLAAALLGVVGWNVSLNRRADRKGRELAAEQLAHVTSELKVNERTRLAVELHDALSQTLTGVSMQIDTAAGIVHEKVPTAKRCLDLASRTIDACRMELRNTLWDLRSAALDEPSMDAAIRKTLCQNLAGVELSVRFNVPRETFSDNTAHTLLKIIRELATNALRHGKATSLKIAGTVEGDKLLFSVKDNGCGFDPDLAPGIAQGHFGLQGVAERLERLNGEMTIDSAPGKGTKVTVALAIPRSGV